MMRRKLGYTERVRMLDREPPTAGTVFATGSPAFEITTSSPAATRRSSFEKCVFASCTFASMGNRAD